METEANRFPFREQLRILVETITASDGNPYGLIAIAQKTGLSEQSLQYMLDGRTQNPRLDSLRKLCSFYQVSLDYFECETETECRAFLAQNAANSATQVIREIDQQAKTLTPSANGNVLRLLDRIRFLRGSRKH